MTAAFSGEPVAVWLTEPKRDDRAMKLVEAFWFDDRKGKRWEAPAGAAIDGASIPRPLWALVGSPYTGRYRRASVVHDRAYFEAGNDLKRRRAADRMFYEACRAGGCSIAEAITLYAGLRVGSRWHRLPASDAATGVMRTSEAGDPLIGDFAFLRDHMLSKGETDDPREVERRADTAEARLDVVEAMASASSPM